MIKSVYIHIPFCSSICSYCDFPKLYYNKCYIKKYLEILTQEIKDNYKNEVIETLYIGGGTPSSLTLEELKELFDIISIFKLSEHLEFTIECNLENLTKEKLDIFKQNKVNRLSIGVQTFNQKQLKFLGRKTCDTDIIKTAKQMGFDNINIDLMYALPGETLADLKNDLNEFVKLDINHLSIYSLIIEPNTVLSINKVLPIEQDLDYEMYKYIIEFMQKNNYLHYEISNFSKLGYESKHNLNYWNNNEYYGFGMGASSYIGKNRITNTKSIDKYLKKDIIYEIEEVNNKLKMEYEAILGLRKIKGINLSDFKEKYNHELEEIFNIENLLKEGKLIKENNHLRIKDEYLYLSNDILINFIGE